MTSLQFIHDNQGNTTGVFIPIEQWQMLKAKYAGLQNEEVQNLSELTSWQTQIVEERLADYYKNPEDVADFDKMIDEIEEGL